MHRAVVAASRALPPATGQQHFGHCQREGKPQQRSLQVGTTNLCEGLGGCLSWLNDARAGPERPHLTIAAGRQLRFPGIEIGREYSDRVSTAEEIVEPHLRWTKRRSTFDGPLSIIGDESGGLIR